MLASWNWTRGLRAVVTIVALSYLFVTLVVEGISFFDRYDNWFITRHFRCWLLMFQNPVPWPRILESESILIAVCAMAFVIGCTVFYVRDIKS